MNLLDYRFDKHSSSGNDGIIEYIFKTLKISNGLFVEFGAWDGKKLSNCRKLFEEGWSGVFVEAKEDRYKTLCENYKDTDRVHCVHAMVGPMPFDVIMKPYVKNRIDFCSIDIDGLDLDVFETFDKYLPTVICMEGGQMLEPYYYRVASKISAHNIQQSLSVIDESIREKGYKILCSYQDAFIVKQELYDKFDVSSDLMLLYLDGLKAIPHRMPWIQKTVREAGLVNRVIDNILRNCDFDKYGYKRRKEWAQKEEPKIHAFIEVAKEKYKNTSFYKGDI